MKEQRTPFGFAVQKTPLQHLLYMPQTANCCDRNIMTEYHLTNMVDISSVITSFIWTPTLVQFTEEINLDRYPNVTDITLESVEHQNPVMDFFSFSI